MTQQRECEHKLIYKYSDGLVCSDCGLKIPYKEELPVWPLTYKSLKEFQQSKLKDIPLSLACQYLDPKKLECRAVIERINKPSHTAWRYRKLLSSELRLCVNPKYWRTCPDRKLA